MHKSYQQRSRPVQAACLWCMRVAFFVHGAPVDPLTSPGCRYDEFEVCDGLVCGQCAEMRLMWFFIYHARRGSFRLRILSRFVVLEDMANALFMRDMPLDR